MRIITNHVRRGEVILPNKSITGGRLFSGASKAFRRVASGVADTVKSADYRRPVLSASALPVPRGVRALRNNIRMV